ncbi:anti-sigma factor family protein [Streptomyces smyrnaeus]|uniref:anti-sigma factor family protein n=1 Tax=Streptomyces smyrnaeus TaxID=1387713 RepID=UPI0034113665
MTSASTPFPHGEHPEIPEISALGEGILPVERQADLRAHLAECELCADVYASLEEIRETLGTLPGPTPMPEDVANRIEAALAAEALLSATAPEEAETTPSEKAAADDEAAPDSRTASQEGAVSRETATPVPLTVRRRKRTVLLVAAASVAALTLGGITLRELTKPAPGEVSSETAQSATGKHAPKDLPSSTSSTDTDAGGSSDDQQLRKRVQRLLSGEGSPSPSQKPPGNSAPPSDSPSVDTKQSPSSDDNTLRDDTLGGGQSVPSCVRDGIHRTETPLAVAPDALFENRTGYLVVLPHQGGNPKLVDAYLVDPSCISADPPAPGKVLFKGTYPRG